MEGIYGSVEEVYGPGQTMEEVYGPGQTMEGVYGPELNASSAVRPQGALVIARSPTYVGVDPQREQASRH